MRRRLMLRNVNGSGFEPFPVSPWTFRTQINSSGQVQTGMGVKYSAVSEYYPVNAGDKFVRTSGNTDSNGNQVTNWIHELRAQSSDSGLWIKRTALRKGEEYTVGEGCTYVRFACAYPSAAGKTMTQDVIDECFAVSRKEG